MIFPDLPENQAHVWRCDLDRISPSEYSVAADEHARAAKFHFERDKNRFLAGRGVLRQLLANYLNVSAEDLKFVVNSHGKPDLPENLQDNSHALRFNISHSQNHALFAFGFDFDIGVDIEFQREDFDAEKISRLANRFFTPNENRALSTLESLEKREAFFRLWTRKEALLKAVGTGVSGGLSRFEISCLSEETPRVLAPRKESKNWTLFDLEVEAEYSGALAVRAENTTEYSVCQFQFIDEPRA